MEDPREEQNDDHDESKIVISDDSYIQQPGVTMDPIQDINQFLYAQELELYGQEEMDRRQA